MAMKISKGAIANALTSKAPNHIIAVAADVFDENLQKYQSEINEDVESRVSKLEKGGGGGSSSSSASDVTFNPTGTGLASTNVQEAITEVKDALDNAVVEGGGVVIVNDLTTGGTNKALSAEMGKELSNGYQYIGIATPDTVPMVTTAKIYYEASEVGTYANFGGIKINNGEVAYLKWNGTKWLKSRISTYIGFNDYVEFDVTPETTTNIQNVIYDDTSRPIKKGTVLRFKVIGGDGIVKQVDIIAKTASNGSYTYRGLVSLSEGGYTDVELPEDSAYIVTILYPINILTAGTVGVKVLSNNFLKTDDAINELSSQAESINQLQEDTTSVIGKVESIMNSLITEKVTSGVIVDISGAFSIKEVSKDDCVIVGSNLIDKNAYKHKIRLDDSGNEVADATSGYYDVFIPVVGRRILSVNFKPQRIYYYGKDKTFLGRPYASGSVITIPETYNSVEVGYVKFQIGFTDRIDLPQVNYGETLLEYGDFKSNTTLTPYQKSYLYSESLDEVIIKLDVLSTSENNSLTIPNYIIPDVWEPTIVDEGYSTPRGYTNTKRENWTAENKYMYYDFLDAYYNRYISRTYNDGYRVNKRSLGQDSSNLGYEIFEYDFCPKSYTKVVMISAGMNSLETSCIWGLATFIRELIEGEDTFMQFLKENVRFKIIPFICPSSFDQEPLKYGNYRDVRVNKNFSYRLMWSNVGGEAKGEYPDSERETIILKNWINENSGIADAYIDCHSDVASPDYTSLLTQVICSDSSTKLRIQGVFPALKEFYVGKGYATSVDNIETQSWVEGGNNYPKTLYSYIEAGIPAIMIEQYISSVVYGSDGNTNNDSYGIKHYVTVLRMYVAAMLESSQVVYQGGSVGLIDYRLNIK